MKITLPTIDGAANGDTVHVVYEGTVLGPGKDDSSMEVEVDEKSVEGFPADSGDGQAGPEQLQADQANSPAGKGQPAGNAVEPWAGLTEGE